MAAGVGFLPDSEVKAAELYWVIRMLSKKESFRAQEGVSR